MAATVQIGEKNGAGGTFTDKTSGTIRFKNADDATVDLNNPMVKPGAGGHDYSFEKWLRLKITGGTFTQVSNVKVYSDGSIGWTGVTPYAKAVASFATPAQATGTAGYTALSTYTSGSSLSLGAGPYDNTGVPKEIADHAVLMIDVADTATQGVLTGETLTFAWDEI